MMSDPFFYVKTLEGKSYAELVIIRDEIREEVKVFESDYDMTKQRWDIDPSPSVMYQWNLTVLSMLESLIKETFHNEYEAGGEDMKMIYENLKDSKI